jgi:hypothetical protein
MRIQRERERELNRDRGVLAARGRPDLNSNDL